jgi:ribose 5-phosphate isomerase RpiB
MIFTARQLEDLHKTNGHVRLPVGARLTPLANDWLRHRKISVMYDGQATPAAPVSTTPAANVPTINLPTAPGMILWWCDGPCGAAKAALAAQARETNLQPMPVTAEPKYLVAAVKQLANEIKADRATAGVLLVQTGAAAVVYANRCPSLRAILGTCRDAVVQGIDQLAANVLVIETPYQTLQQTRNLLSQFVRGRKVLGDDVKRQLAELATCG